MILSAFSDWPSPKLTKITLFFSIVLLAIIYPVLMYFFSISNYPVGFLESQLSFSGTIIKSHYASMNVSEIRLYIVANIIDYGFMLSYGLLIFTLGLYLSRKFNSKSVWRKTGYIIALFGIGAAVCDGTENVFILLMANDSTGFPDTWALTHSAFALIKYILMLTAISWLIIAAIFRTIRKQNAT